MRNGSWRRPRAPRSDADRDRLRCLDLLDGLLASLDRPPEERDAELDRLLAAVREERGAFEGVTDPLASWWESLLGMRTECVARARLARVGLALLEHRQETGAWPERLEDLAPRLGGAVPLDPSDHRPFTYERTAERIRIASRAGPPYVIVGEPEVEIAWELPAR